MVEAVAEAYGGGVHVFMRSCVHAFICSRVYMYIYVMCLFALS